MSSQRPFANDRLERSLAESTALQEQTSLLGINDQPSADSAMVRFMLAVEISRLLLVSSDARADCQAMEDDIDDRDRRIADLEARLLRATSEVKILRTALEERGRSVGNGGKTQTNGYHSGERGSGGGWPSSFREEGGIESNKSICFGCSHELPELRVKVKQLESMIHSMIPLRRKLSNQQEISEDDLRGAAFKQQGPGAYFNGNESPLNTTTNLESFEYHPSLNPENSSKHYEGQFDHRNEDVDYQKSLKKNLAPSIVFTSSLTNSVKHNELSDRKLDKKLHKLGGISGTPLRDTFRKPTGNGSIGYFQPDKPVDSAVDIQLKSQIRSSSNTSGKQQLFRQSSSSDKNLLDTFKLKLQLNNERCASTTFSKLSSKKTDSKGNADKFKNLRSEVIEEHRRSAKSIQQLKESAPVAFSDLNNWRLPNRYSINDQLGQLKLQRPFSSTDSEVNLRHSKANSSNLEFMGASVSQSSFSRLLYKGAKDHRKRLGMMAVMRPSLSRLSANDINN